MQGKPPKENQIKILIRMHYNANMGFKVYYMKKFRVKLRVFLNNRIVETLLKTKHLDLSSFVYNDFKNDRLVEEGIIFIILIKNYVNKFKLGDITCVCM